MEEQLSKYLEVLAEKLGVALPYLYEVLYRQQIVSGIVWGLVSIVWLIGFYFTVKFFIKKQDEGYIYENDLEVVVFTVYFVGGLLSLMAVWELIDSILQIINPEYYVIKDILRSIK